MTEKKKLDRVSPEEMEAWCAQLPDFVAAVARKYPPDRCYRSTQNPRFHYVIGSYEENAGNVCTLKLVHGRDSTLPGVATFGQPPDQLIECDCGKWEPPTDGQTAVTGAWLKAEGKRDRKRKKRLREMN